MLTQSSARDPKAARSWRATSGGRGHAESRPLVISWRSSQEATVRKRRGRPPVCAIGSAQKRNRENARLRHRCRGGRHFSKTSSTRASLVIPGRLWGGNHHGSCRGLGFEKGHVM